MPSPNAGSESGDSMSGRGVVSIRLPVPLLTVLNAEANERGLDVHDLAREAVQWLCEMDCSELRALSEPHMESTGERVSLYIGQEDAEALASLSEESGLPTSSLLRRALNETVFVESFDSVQHSAATGNNVPPPLALLLVPAIGLFVILIVLGIRILRKKFASRQQKGKP